MMLPFVRDERASLPRPLRRPLAPEASLAGVPAALRERVGKNLVSTAFPYAQFLQSDGRCRPVELELVELENARWLVVLCPSLGGRVLRIYDHRWRRELLLPPPLLRQGVVGLAGAWFVGGVEFNAFRWGHNIHGSSRLETRRLQLRDGTPAVEFGACDELFDCSWQVSVALGEEQVFFRVELANHGDRPQPDYWWTNLAVPAHRHIRVMGAPGPVLHHGMFRVGYQHDVWPRLHGRDWSRWPEHHEIASAYLYENHSDFFGYVDERDGFALVHQADATVCRGRKLWSIGAGFRDIFSDRLLETAGTSYLELQSGLNPMQVEAGRLQPGERRAWTESIGAVALPESANSTDYASLFARYEKTASAAMRSEYCARKNAEAWRADADQRIVAADPRVALSSRIVRMPQTVTSAEVASAVERGWVAGDAWRRKLGALLAAKQLAAAGRLALAAAKLDAGETEDAIASLRELARGNDAAAGWAAYLAGLYTNERPMLERSMALLPGRVEPWLAFDQLLAVERQHGERAALWQRAPAAWRERDDVRVAQAAGAHARGEWELARHWLEAPLLTIPEGAPTPWLCYRETFVAEAFARLRDGDEEGAAALLFRAGQAMPQFGMGRDEAGWGADLIYYRWRLALKSGRQLEAALLLEQGMQLDAYAGGFAAAYLAWLAQEAAHPSAPARLAKLREWDRDTGEGARGFTPLRAAVVDALSAGDMTRWHQLRDDPVFSFRADFELSLPRPTPRAR